MRSRFISLYWLAALLLLLPCTSWANDPELDALLLESSNLMQDGRVDEAMILLEGAESQYRDSHEYMNNLAVAYLGNNQAERALGIFRELVDNDPIYSIIAHNLLEMELQLSDSRPVNINPVLFVQSIESYYEQEQGQASAPVTELDEEPIPTGLNATIETLMETWASRWSNKDLIGYLSMYSRNFIGPGGEDFREWVSARRGPLSKPGPISVELSNIDIDVMNNRQVEARFDQAYDSSNYSDRVRKQLVFALEDEGWKIIREVTLETY